MSVGMSDLSNELWYDECTHLRVFLNGNGGLIPDTRLVHLRSNDGHQIKRIVKTRGRKALDLFRFSVFLAADGGFCGHVGSNDRTRSGGDGTGTRGLGRRFLLGSGFLCVSRRLFFCEQSRVLRFAGKLRLSLLLLILLAFGGPRAIFPFSSFRLFLENYACASMEGKEGVLRDCAHLCFSFCRTPVCLVLGLLCATTLFLCVSALGSHDCQFRAIDYRGLRVTL